MKIRIISQVRAKVSGTFIFLFSLLVFSIIFPVLPASAEELPEALEVDIADAIETN